MRSVLRWAACAGIVSMAACGGRSSHESPSEEAGGSQASQAGSASATGGASSSAGSVSSGASMSNGASFNGCNCPDIDCAPGFQRAPHPSGCCETCQPLPCPDVPCPGIACASGSHLEQPEGQCCPVCVRDTVNLCRAGLKDYFEMREPLLEKYGSTGCNVDSDCGLLVEDNRCIATCGFPLPAAYVADASQNLSSFAEKSCAGCARIPIPPCEPSGLLRCELGRCIQR